MSINLLDRVLNGRYRVIRPIGEGGMGQVYLAQDERLDTLVAVKFIKPELSDSASSLDSLVREARIIARLKHQNILTVHNWDVDNAEGSPLAYLVMEYVSGGTLFDRIRKSALSRQEAERVLSEVCAAIEYAHGEGVIHLDLKPQNILFDDNKKVYVTDFGLSKLLESRSHTKGDTGVGTPEYMPPEQIYGSEVGPFSDIYALGITLHEMLTGKRPKRNLESNTLEQDVTLPLDVRQVIETATKTAPKERYRKAGELAWAFSAAIHSSPGQNLPLFGNLLPPSTNEFENIPLPSPPALPTSYLTDAKRSKLQQALRELGQFCEDNPNIIEREVVNFAFKPEGLFTSLGYEAGKDVRLELKNADVVLWAFSSRPQAVVEFKRPNLSALEGFEQLERKYIVQLLPDVGVLCNGRELWVYRRAGTRLAHPPVLRVVLKDATELDAKTVYDWLGRREIDFTAIETFERALLSLTKNAVLVRGPDEPNGQAFINRFTLSPNTPFGRLVQSMASALPEMLEKSKFTQGAYAFWRRIYARETSSNDVPPVWKTFISNTLDKEWVYHFMFSLESSYAILSRLLLVRAMENHGFPQLHDELVGLIVNSLKLRRSRGRINSTAYALALRSLFEYAGRQAFQNIFASDIFDWWYDLEKTDQGVHVGEKLAESILTVFEFDFSLMTGDLLGGLYQNYFDSETRKALGEFYTPVEVVDFILDEVGYNSNVRSLHRSRLLDPSCGSGTFLVRALQRYLKTEFALTKSAAEILKELLGNLRIIGFDINPFAVLMAQVNYAAQIIPLYARALQETDLPSTLSIPILRTDSLRQEQREGDPTFENNRGYTQLSVFQEDNFSVISTTLPVEVRPGEFFSTNIPVPRFDVAREKGWIGSAEEYFYLLRVLFDAVGEGKTSVTFLVKQLQAANLPHPEDLAEYIKPVVAHLVAEMQRLREEFDDGRFLKTLADLALALVLKSDVWYDFVVGNPPYIRNQLISEGLRRQWEQWYKWAEGSYDAYILLMERSIYVEHRAINSQHEWLKIGGKLGFICSDRFLLINYGGEMRTQIAEKCSIELLVDFRISTVFNDAENSPAVIILKRVNEKSEQKDFPVVRFTARVDEKGVRSALPDISSAINQLNSGDTYLIKRDFDAFRSSHSHLLRKAWLLMPDTEREVLNTIEEAATIYDADDCLLCKSLPASEQEEHPHILRLEHTTSTRNGVFQTISTGDDAVFILKVVSERANTLILKPKGVLGANWHGPTEVEIEKELLRKWLFGRNVDRWYADWDNWYVFLSHAVIEALEKKGENWVPIRRYRPIPTTENLDYYVTAKRYIGDFPVLDRDYPRAWQTFLSNPFIKKRLQAREGGAKFNKPKNWYLLSYPRSIDLYDKPKLLVQIASPLPDFAFDDNIHFLLQHGGRGAGTDAIILKEGLDYWLILGLLNSSPLDYYLKHISPIFNNSGSYSYSDAFVKQLPIKLPLTLEEMQQAKTISGLTQEIVQIKATIEQRKLELKGFPELQTRALTTRFGDIFPLRRIITGEPKAKTFQKSSVSVNVEIDGTVRFVLGKTVLFAESQSVADVAMEWLRLQNRSSINFDDLLAIRVPVDVSGAQEILRSVREAEREIQQNQLLLTEKEKILDDLICTYYSLSEQDREIIAEFLKRFSAPKKNGSTTPQDP